MQGSDSILIPALTKEAEAGRSLEFEASLTYKVSSMIVRTVSKTNKANKQQRPGKKKGL